MDNLTPVPMIELRHVEKPVVTIGIFRTLFLRKHPFELGRYSDCVDQYILCRSRMDVAALEVNAGFRSIEVLVFEFPEFASVNCIGIIHAESLYVEVIRASSDLLV